jgi:hypothetical protein
MRAEAAQRLWQVPGFAWLARPRGPGSCLKAGRRVCGPPGQNHAPRTVRP